MRWTRRQALRGILSGFAVTTVAGRHARAVQDARPVRVGLLLSGTPDRWAMIEQSVRAGLAELGYVEEKNLSLLKRSGTYPDSRMAQHARDLVASDVGVIITSCGWTARSAMRATSTIPIILGGIANPVGRGFVKNLARPGINVTGVTGSVNGLAPKMLEHLAASFPRAKSIGAVINVASVDQREILERLEPVSQSLGVSLIAVDIERFATPGVARDELRSMGVQALLVLPEDDRFLEFFDSILATGLALRMPTMFSKRDFVELGGLMSFGPDPRDLFRRTARYVDRIARGANAAELPIEQPKNLELTINLDRANALGIVISRSILMRADYVVK